MDPESVKRTNLLKVRQVRMLRKEVEGCEEDEHFLLGPKTTLEATLAALRDLRQQTHRLEHEFTLKEFHAKEKKWQAVKTAALEKGSTKKASKVADELIKEQVKIEREHEASLLKQIAALQRQQLDLKLRQIQFAFIPDDMLDKNLEKILKQQKNILHQLEHDLHKYEHIDLSEAASTSVSHLEPKSEVEDQKVAAANAKLALEIKQLTKSLKKARKESEKLDEKLTEAEEINSELRTEMSDFEEWKTSFKGVEKKVDAKDLQVDELRLRLQSLKKTLHEQESEFPELVEAQEILEKLVFGASDTEKLQLEREELAATEETILQVESKMSKLVEEEIILLQEQKRLQTQISTTTDQREMEEMANEETVKGLKADIKGLNKELQRLQQTKRQIQDERVAKLKVWEHVRVSLRGKSERLESKGREHRRHLAALEESVQLLEKKVSERDEVVREAQEWAGKVEGAQAEVAALEKEDQDLVETCKAAVAEGIDLRSAIELHKF